MYLQYHHGHVQKATTVTGITKDQMFLSTEIGSVDRYCIYICSLNRACPFYDKTVTVGSGNDDSIHKQALWCSRFLTASRLSNVTVCLLLIRQNRAQILQLSQPFLSAY